MRIYLVDAFAHAPFTGNPAGVCPLEREPDGAWMQGVAMEMNQAETAFFWPEGEGYRLRWFTPTAEVDLCGHATLASAHVLFSDPPLRVQGLSRGEVGGPSPRILGRGKGEGPTTEVRFLTRSGELVCRQVGEEIEMDFPSEAPTAQETTGIAEALGAAPVWQGANRMDYFFELESEEAVRGLTPDLAALARLGMRGVIVTGGVGVGVGGGSGEQGAGSGEQGARSGEQGAGLGVVGAPSTLPPTPTPTPTPDFVSRFFAPRFGIAEDPVTGSAHCALGPYWSAKLGKRTLVGYQASPRGGFVTVTANGPRTTLAGQAKTVLVGSLLP